MVSVSLLVRRVHEAQYFLVIVIRGGAPRGGYTALLVNYITENISTGFKLTSSRKYSSSSNSSCI